MDALGETLKGRLAWRQATVDAIAAARAGRSNNQPARSEGLSYAETLLFKAKQLSEVNARDNREVSHKQAFMANPPIKTQPAIQPRKEVNAQQQEGNQKDNWTLVTRKHKEKTVQQTTRRIHPELQKQKVALMAENRCFRCLSKGHKSSGCRNTIRCLKCRNYGHTAGRCTAIKNKSISPTKEFAENTVKQTLPGKQKNKEKQTNIMQGIDWETMDLLPPSLVEGRPGTMRVYLPPRARGNTSYGILDYSAVVLAGPHHADPYLSQRIATALGGHFDMHPRDFRVTAPDATIGDRFVEFPDIDLCRRAVREGYFLLANGTEVQLIQWTPELGMERYPMLYRARVKLFGVPVYNRNEREINHLISGIGYVDNMTSVYMDGRFESLRVLIACHDPKNIPQELLMTTNPRAKIVRVQLEGFINIANDLLPPSPPNEPQPPLTLWQARGP